MQQVKRLIARAVDKEIGYSFRRADVSLENPPSVRQRFPIGIRQDSLCFQDLPLMNGLSLA